MNAPRSETERESGGGDVTMVETSLSDFSYGGIGWFDDKPKYRKIARLANPSALRAYTQIADLRLSLHCFSSSSDSTELPLLRET